MLDTSTNGIVLTKDQVQQIDVAKQKLSNIEMESFRAAKTLRGTKLECSRMVAELSDNNEKLSSLKKDIDTLEKLKLQLESDIATFNNELGIKKESIAKSLGDIAQRESELGLRKQNIIVSEENNKKKSDELAAQLSEVSREKSLLMNAKNALIQTIQSIQWS